MSGERLKVIVNEDENEDENCQLLTDDRRQTTDDGLPPDGSTKP
jgi:hypothetical protein